MKKYVFVFAFTIQMVAVAQNQQIETYFNLPLGQPGNISTEVENNLIRLIRAARPQSTLRGSFYTFSRVPVAQELVSAGLRGVDVQLVLDDKNKNETSIDGSALNLLANGLKCAAEKCMTFCKGGCSGLHINHNKFILFSDLGALGKAVVAQTSSNMTQGQLKNYNDLIVIKNDQAFYDGLMGYWKRLQKDKFSTDKYDTIQGQNGIKSYFFPRLFSEDPVLKILKLVRCNLPNSKVRVIQSRFDDDRVKVAQEMARIAKDGCDVKVITRDEPDKKSPGKQVKDWLGKNLAILPYKGDDDDNVVNSIHSKIILIGARIKDENNNQMSTVVLTGSHNLNGTSLKTNDETMFKITDVKTYESYLRYWNKLNKDIGAF